MKKLTILIVLFCCFAQAQERPAAPKDAVVAADSPEAIAEEKARAEALAKAKVAAEESAKANESQSVANDRSVNTIKLTQEKVFTRSNFTLGTSLAQLKGKNSSALAFGPKGGFEYGLTEKVALGASMSFTFQGSGNAVGAFFYSGLAALFKYSVVGTGVKVGSEVHQKDGTLVYSSRPIAKRRIALCGGIEQLFLNGATSIYPAIGPTVGVSAAFGIARMSIEFDLTTSALMANDNPLSMTQVGVNLNLDM